MRVKTITAKLGTMRKEQKFVVYPRKDGDPVIVQSDKSIGQFDPVTGEGVLNQKESSFLGLNGFLGAKPYKFPEEFVTAALEAQARSGQEIGPGVYVM